MNTQSFYTKTVIVFLLFALLLSACATAKADTKATEQAIYRAASVAADIDPDTGILTMRNHNGLDDIAPGVIAINAVITGQAGAFMLFNDLQHLAIFVSPVGKAGNYQLFAVVDTANTALLSADRIMNELGVTMRDINNIEDFAARLKERGFERLVPASVPTLAASLRLGIAFLRTLGGTISDIIMVPAVLLTPEQLYPVCHDNPDSCVEIKQ